MARRKWNPPRDPSSDSADVPRRDVGDYRAPAARTGRQQRELGSWAKGVSDSLTEPTPAQKAARERELRELYTERAAIFEYLGGYPRAHAEQLARELVYGAPP